jgi:hypothetical protein
MDAINTNQPYTKDVMDELKYEFNKKNQTPIITGNFTSKVYKELTQVPHKLAKVGNFLISRIQISHLKPSENDFKGTLKQLTETQKAEIQRRAIEISKPYDWGDDLLLSNNDTNNGWDNACYQTSKPENNRNEIRSIPNTPDGRIHTALMDLVNNNKLYYVPPTPIDTII